MYLRPYPWTMPAMMLGVVLCLGAPHHATAAPETNAVPGIMFGGDLTLSGTRRALLALAGNIAITGGTMGDVAIAAGTLQMTGGDISRIAVSGGTVAFDGGRLGDVAVAAGILKINGHISRDLRATAGTIVSTRDTVIGGDARFSGGDVTIDGTVIHNLRIRAEHISLAGTIGGTARLIGEEITLAPGTHIDGDLIYEAPEELQIPAGVVVAGKIARAEMGSHERPHGHAHHGFYAAWALGFGGLVLCGLVVLLAWPSMLALAGVMLTRRFPASLVTGLIVVCAVPAAGVILAVTLVGLPLSLLLLAAAAALIGFGLVTVSQWAGSRVRTRFGAREPVGPVEHLGWGVAGFAIFIVIGSVPVIGWAAQTLAVLAGSGAVLLSAWDRRPQTAGPAR